MRLKSSVWVAAYLRRCNLEGAFAAVRRHGADDAGVVFIKVNWLNGTGTLYGPAAPTEIGENQLVDRYFHATLGVPHPVSEADIEARLVREIRFDPDIWILEIEDRIGRHFLDGALI